MRFRRLILLALLFGISSRVFSAPGDPDWYFSGDFFLEDASGRLVRADVVEFLCFDKPFYRAVWQQTCPHIEMWIDQGSVDHALGALGEQRNPFRTEWMLTRNTGGASPAELEGLLVKMTAEHEAIGFGLKLVFAVEDFGRRAGRPHGDLRRPVQTCRYQKVIDPQSHRLLPLEDFSMEPKKQRFVVDLGPSVHGQKVLPVYVVQLRTEWGGKTMARFVRPDQYQLFKERGFAAKIDLYELPLAVLRIADRQDYMSAWDQALDLRSRGRYLSAFDGLPRASRALAGLRRQLGVGWKACGRLIRNMATVPARPEFP